MSDSQATLQVAVDAPLAENLTYLQNPDAQAQRGDIVEVKLGNRKTVGLVVKSENLSPEELEKIPFGLKQIESISSDWPRLPENHVKWLEWVADYYLYPLGKVVQNCFPPLDKAVKARKSDRPPVIPVTEIQKPHELTSEQKSCVDAILSEPGFVPHLIHGVTGSGKTEIYLELFEEIIKKNQQGLFLLPEISLTPQLISRFARRFGNEIAVLHSQLTDRERTNQWWDIVEGRKRILIGARSAQFCPLKNLGLVVIDEEHEASFKQDESLRYNGRDTAIMLARFNNCPVVMGSATPSLDSWKNATIDRKFRLHQIKNRVNSRPLPSIEVIDMRLEKDLQKKAFEKPNWLSQSLYEQIQNSLEKKEQVALLLNRRGQAQLVFCPSCGHTAECPNCDISLSLHAHTHLVCHYCDYHENFNAKCSQCKEGELMPMGLGTEKVENDLKLLFPDKIIARADRDEVQSRLEMEELVKKMEDNEIDILIGTQMIAKGLDFSNLKLVGLLLADIAFNLPDFRASERSFQLITQMGGRAGRHVKEDELPGKVVIQTYNTEHESITFAQNHDYIKFAQIELGYRQQLNYPPFHKLAAVKIQSTHLNQAQLTGDLVAQRAEKLKSHFSAFSTIEVLGPAAAPIAKLRNQFRYHLLLKSPDAKLLNQFLKKLIGNGKWVPKQGKVSVDVDPLNLL